MLATRSIYRVFEVPRTICSYRMMVYLNTFAETFPIHLPPLHNLQFEDFGRVLRCRTAFGIMHERYIHEDPFLLHGNYGAGDKDV
jgi:hypothetical protein